MNESSEAKLHFLDYWRVIRVRFGIILLAFILVVTSAGVVTYFSPRYYRSSVFMQVSSNESGITPFERNQDSREAIDPGYAATQYEIIQRKEVLNPVVKQLKLIEKWGEQGQQLQPEQAYY